MNNELFNNVGKNIKSIAKAIANIILALHILLGAVLVIAGLALNEPITFLVALLMALVLIGFGYGLSKLTVMLLYAYGEIAYRLISIDLKLSDDSKTVNSDKITAEKKIEDNTPCRTDPWKCQFCGYQNPADAKFCESCGTEDIGI